MYEDHSNRKLGIAYGGERPSWTPEQWAAHFGRKTVTDIFDHMPIDVVEGHARLAGSFARIALEHQAEREQDERNRQHRIELARAFATLPQMLKQEAADRALTDYLGGRQARLDEVTED